MPPLATRKGLSRGNFLRRSVFEVLMTAVGIHPATNTAFAMAVFASPVSLQYVAYSFHFSLEQIAISLHDDNAELLSLCVHKTAVKFEGRPSAGGVKLVLH